MDNKQILNREDSENESVLLSDKTLETLLSLYYTVTDVKRYSQDIESIKYAQAVKRVRQIYGEGEVKMREAIDLALPTDTKAYLLLADSVEEAAGLLLNPWGNRAEEFIVNRYPTLFSSFLGYLEFMVLAGMRSGYLNFTWWRAVDYGFSVTPYTEEEKLIPNAFPYLNVEDMPEGDRRAFRWIVEDVFHIALMMCFYFHVGRKGLTEEEYKAIEEGNISFYNKDGYTEEEIINLFSQRFTKEDLGSFDFEILLCLPIVVSRLDEALYYATKYRGTEYKEYIKSLNVEEDYNYNLGDLEKYNKIMEEGYVWHWAE